MCGRVRLSTDFSQIKIRLKLDDIYPAPNYPARWNIPPTAKLLCVVRDPERGTRRAEMMRWGLIPAWAKDEKIGYSTFNARDDGIDSKPAFRGVWKAGRRCLVVTDGFYEWRKPDKQPFAISCAKGALTVMAGLWETWRSPASGEVVKSCTIVTCPPNELIEPLHDRMPVILAERDWPLWLGEVPTNPAEAKTLLRPYPASEMELWPVDKRVGKVGNEGPELAVPIRLAG
jgi:putative SOS response-associated peptidase YedK